MSSTLRTEYVPDVVSSPGETLQDVLEERDLSQADLAQRTGRTKKTINEIIKGKAPITPETALQLEKVLGIPATFWNNRELAYRAFLARKAEDERLQRDVDWIKEVPYRDMVRHGWVLDSRDKIGQVRELLSFYGVASREQWLSVAIRPQTSFRRSKTFESDPGALSAWLRRGEIEAGQLECGPFDRKSFLTVLERARKLTTAPPEQLVPPLTRMCAGCGVAVVFVPEPRGLRVRGATRWVSPSRAIIQLSLRCKTDDDLWFTFFHEAGHILFHNKREVFVESEDLKRVWQTKASRFAANHLIPKDIFRRLRQDTPRSEEGVVAIARELGIAPGIVVGQLQREGLLSDTQLNGLKQELHWAWCRADHREKPAVPR